MTKRIFPIKTDPACLLKWNWSTVFLHQGTSASCHRTRHYKIDPDNFDQFHNLPEKIRDRQNMLEGRWPGYGCEYCEKNESAGGYSDRLMFLDGQEDPAMSPPELFEDATKTSITPTILEVFFKNTCNMKCVYCEPHFSSLWVDEERKFSKTIPITDKFTAKKIPYNPDYDRMVADLWKYLIDQDRYKTLRRYHILGGETFLLSELDDSIDFWDQHPNPELTFSVFSNLNIPHELFKKYIKKFGKLVFNRKIWKLQLTASLDAWGPEQEYSRYGLDSNLWLQNFEYLLDKPWISLSINSALSSLTIKQLPELLIMINNWNAQLHKNYQRFNIEPIHHTFNTTNKEDNLYMFGPGVFDQEFETILSLMPSGTAIQKNQKDLMQGVTTRLLNSTRDLEKIQRLKDYLDILDQRRGTNWRRTFTWLDQDF